MKKLFLPLALLTMSAVYSNASLLKDDEVYESGDDAVTTAQQQAPTAEQIAAQQAYFQNLGDQLASNLLQDPKLTDWYNDASDEDVAAFDALCVQYATLNFIVYGQFAQNYNQLFNALSDLTGRSNWSVQINFMSNELAQALQAQAQAAADAQADSADDSDDDSN